MNPAGDATLREAEERAAYRASVAGGYKPSKHSRRSAKAVLPVFGC